MCLDACDNACVMAVWYCKLAQDIWWKMDDNLYAPNYNADLMGDHLPQHPHIPTLW